MALSHSLRSQDLLKTWGHLQTRVQSFSVDLYHLLKGSGARSVTSSFQDSKNFPTPTGSTLSFPCGREGTRRPLGGVGSQSKKEKGELPSTSLLPGGLAPIPQELGTSRHSP